MGRYKPNSTLMNECSCWMSARANCDARGPLPRSWHERAPRLTTITKWLNDHTALYARATPTLESTDRKIAGTRLRHPGKGRKGYRLVVVKTRSAMLSPSAAENCEDVVLLHSSAETYRHNGEVVAKLHDFLRYHPEYLRDAK